MPHKSLTFMLVILLLVLAVSGSVRYGANVEVGDFTPFSPFFQGVRDLGWSIDQFWGFRSQPHDIRIHQSAGFQRPRPTDLEWPMLHLLHLRTDVDLPVADVGRGRLGARARAWPSYYAEPRPDWRHDVTIEGELALNTYFPDFLVPSVEQLRLGPGLYTHAFRLLSSPHWGTTIKPVWSLMLGPVSLEAGPRAEYTAYRASEYYFLASWALGAEAFLAFGDPITSPFLFPEEQSVRGLRCELPLWFRWEYDSTHRWSPERFHTENRTELGFSPKLCYGLGSSVSLGLEVPVICEWDLDASWDPLACEYSPKLTVGHALVLGAGFLVSELGVGLPETRLDEFWWYQLREWSLPETELSLRAGYTVSRPRTSPTPGR